MTTIVVGSVRSAGATTLALSLAGWLDRVVLVEADANGGVLALRYGLSREPGLISLAAARDLDSAAAFQHSQLLPGGLPVVVAPESPDRSTHLLRTAGARVAALLAGLDDVTVVVDAGRLSPSSPALCFAETASAVLIVARPLAEELVAAVERVASLNTAGARAGLVLVGAGPYSAQDVEQLGCAVIGTVADDARAARALAEGGSGKALARSALARTARELAVTLARQPGAQAPLTATQADERSEALA